MKCSECSAGYYRLNSECTGCPNAAYMLILGYAGGMVAILALVIYAKLKKVNTSALSIGTDFLQARISSDDLIPLRLGAVIGKDVSLFI